MAERGVWWLEAVASAAVGLAVSLLSVQNNSKDVVPAKPEAPDEPRPEDATEESGLPPVIERALYQLGLRSGKVHERAEQLVAMYKLLKALGMSDADIAKLIVQKAGERVDDGIGQVRPTDARPVIEAVENAMLRAAEEADTRLNMGGDLIRRVRDGAVAARAGREDALTGLERSLGQGREQLRKFLRGSASKDAE
jgi:hypothetical protein